AGYRDSLALMNDHTLRAWGANNDGQLGDGTNNPSFIPVPVSVLSNVVQVSSGWNHNVALSSDGTVWTWGRNLNGELGDNTTIDRNIPVQVLDLSAPFVPTAWLYLPFILR